jgi:hypothetical protein
MQYPRMVRVRQQATAPAVPDVRAAVQAALDAIAVGNLVRPGATVAITVGSRGIANLAAVLRTVAGVLAARGARPFLVPAMGSHGGASAEGQRDVLATLGVTEASIGVPIRSAMETVLLGTTPEGIPVHVDRHAASADHVVLVNRVKPHTTFTAAVESGLLKIATIGLGKQIGAATYHRAIIDHSFERVVESASRVVRAGVALAFGVALVENSSEETAHVEAVLPDDLRAREADLLGLARRLMARLPVEDADLLIVDEMGKNVSGSGMDTNVIGRKPGATGPRIRRIFVRELTANTHGNAYGIGFADFTTTRLVRAVDYRATAVNAVAAAHPEAAMMPMHFDSDREAIEVALATAGLRGPADARVIRIRNTLRMRDVEVSAPVAAELRARPDLEVDGDAHDMTFDAQGNLAPLPVPVSA